MKRNTPLKRSNFKRKPTHKRLSPISKSKTRRKALKVPDNVRWLVLKRSNGKCEKCKHADGTHLHHILPKGRRGKHYLENLKHLCFNCHRWVHANVKPATDAGYLREWNYRDDELNKRECEKI